MTPCPTHSTPGSIHPTLVEQAVMNPHRLPGGMRDWRMYRVEYGFECSCPEGVIYLPPHVDADEIERIMNT